MTDLNAWLEALPLEELSALSAVLNRLRPRAHNAQVDLAAIVDELRTLAPAELYKLAKERSTTLQLSPSPPTSDRDKRIADTAYQLICDRIASLSVEDAYAEAALIVATEPDVEAPKPSTRSKRAKRPQGLRKAAKANVAKPSKRNPNTPLVPTQRPAKESPTVVVPSVISSGRPGPHWLGGEVGHPGSHGA